MENGFTEIFAPDEAPTAAEGSFLGMPKGILALPEHSPLLSEAAEPDRGPINFLFGMPAPYPGELFYSIIARFEERIQSRSIGHIQKILYGNSQKRIHLALPNNLSHFAQQLPPGYRLTAESIIDQHTLFPFFGSFLGKTNRAALRCSMLGKSGLKLEALSGIAKQPTKETKLWLCPSCRSEDVHTFGQAYWHREHQLPGVFVCWRHEEPLWSTPSRLSDPFLEGYLRELVTPDQTDLRMQEQTAIGSSGLLLKHARTAAEYLHGGFKLEPASIKMVYRRKLRELGRTFTYGNDERLRAQTFWDDLCAHLGDSMPSLYWITADASTGSKTLTNIYNATDGCAPRHLMLIEFLGIERSELEEHLPAIPKRHLFPCRNPASSCHYKLSINRYSRMCSNWLNFECPECGYCYSTSPNELERNVPDEQIKYVSKNVGWVWKAKLIELWHRPDLSMKEIAAALNVGQRRLSVEAFRLELPEVLTGPNIRRYCQTNMTAILQNKRFTERMNIREKHCLTDRYEWLDAMARNPQASKLELKRMHSPLWWRLCNCDPEWLRINQPYQKRRAPLVMMEKAGFLRNKKDQHSAELIQIAKNELEGKQKPPQRISKAALLRCLPRLDAKLVYCCKNEPLTAAAIKKAVETSKSYVERRLSWTIEECHRENLRPGFYEFCKMAGVISAIRKDSACAQKAHEAYGRIVEQAPQP